MKEARTGPTDFASAVPSTRRRDGATANGVPTLRTSQGPPGARPTAWGSPELSMWSRRGVRPYLDQAGPGLTDPVSGRLPFRLLRARDSTRRVCRPSVDRGLPERPRANRRNIRDLSPHRRPCPSKSISDDRGTHGPSGGRDETPPRVRSGRRPEPGPPGRNYLTPA
jgi:hypothetical protein